VKNWSCFYETPISDYEVTREEQLGEGGFKPNEGDWATTKFEKQFKPEL
jgi:hypothetical protein